MAFTRLEPTGVNTSAMFTFANANVTTNLNVGGVSNLGPVGNIIITGGTSGQVLSTNGSGGLSWTDQTGGGGGTNYSNSNVAAYLPTFTGNFTAGNISTTGNITAAYFIGNGSQLTGLPASYSNTNVAAYLPTYAGNVSAAYFIGNGSTLTNITGANVSGEVTFAATANSVAGGNVSGQVGNALIAGTVYSNAQPNITSVGILSSLSVTANASAGNILTDNLLYANGVAWNFGGGSSYSNANVAAYLPTYTGNVSAEYFIGNGSLLYSITGGNVTGQVANALVAGTVYTAAQPNITSVGTLTSANVSGNLSSGGNIIGNGQYLTSITGGNVSGQVGNALVAGTVYTNAQPNITSVGTLTALSVTGNISTGNLLTDNLLYANGVAWSFGGGGGSSYSNANVAAYLPTYTGNVSANYFIGNALAIGTGSGGTIAGANLISANYFSGDGSLLTSITGANVTGQVSFAATANSVAGGNVSGQVGNALVAGTVYTAAQPNITSVGTLTSISVSGLTTATGGLKTGNIQDSSGTNTISVSSTTVGVIGNLTIGTGGSGNASATYFIGNGSTLSSITGSNVTGQVGNSLVSGTVYTAAQPNITSLGTLASLGVSGTATFALSSDRTTYVSTSTSGTYTADVSAAGPVWYFTTIGGATTLNFTNLPTTDGYTTVLAVMFSGTTVVPAVQIAGSAQTIKWITGTAPTGNASGINIYTFSCVRVNSAWTAVLGSYTYYA